MSIRRSTKDLDFGQWISERVIFESKENPPEPNVVLGKGAGWKLVTIPLYQRGIAWGKAQLESLVNETAVVLGNVLLNETEQKKLPEYYDSTTVELLDGLQRFAAGTALAKAFFDKHSNEKNSRVAGLMTNNVVNHNHKTLMTAKRQAVRESYIKFFREAESLITDWTPPSGCKKSLVEVLNDLFGTMIFEDQYSGIDTADAATAFVRLNNDRIALGEVDLLRARIIQKGMQANWDATKIEFFESEYSRTFLNSSGRLHSHLARFVNVLFAADDVQLNNVFPAWNNLGGPEYEDVMSLLSHVQNFEESGDPYLEQIRRWPLPYAGVIVGSWRENPGNVPPPAALRKVYRASIRCVVFDILNKEKIIKLVRNILEESETSELLERLANKMALEACENRGIDELIDKDIIREQLESVSSPNQSKLAMRLFKAMCLPDLSDQSDPGDESFSFIKFGNSNMDWNIDHIFPKSRTTKTNTNEANRIVNLAPLPKCLNNSVQSLMPSNKIPKTDSHPGGVYGSEGAAEHPYNDWLNRFRDENDKLEDGNPEKVAARDYNDENVFVEKGNKIGSARLDGIAEILSKKI